MSKSHVDPMKDLDTAKEFFGKLRHLQIGILLQAMEDQVKLLEKQGIVPEFYEYECPRCKNMSGYSVKPPVSKKEMDLCIDQDCWITNALLDLAVHKIEDQED